MTSSSLAEQEAADLERFSVENHRHLTILQTIIRATPGQVRGWKLWCMNCGLQGRHDYLSIDEAKEIADRLRNVVDPQCQHRQHANPESR